MKIENIILLCLSLLFILILMSHLVIITAQPTNNSNVMGGCAGTRYGCCPDGKTSKLNRIGSNCNH